MTGIRRLTTSALAAAIALLTGLSGALADELTDLRANQELLKQRIDQLALGAPNPVAPGSASMAGSFPRSFLIPGTNTSLLIGGQIDLNADYFITGGNPNNTGGGTQILGGPGLSSVALHEQQPTRARGNGVFNYSIYDSRLNVETRTPTAWGEAQTRVEFDFLGCSLGGIICNNTVAGQDGLGLRLRLAYGTLGGFVFGQAYNPTTDLAASAEVLDTGCCAGDFGTGRQPQVGYTWELPTWMGPASLFVSLVSPEDSVATPNGGTLTNNSNPAFIGGGSIPGTTLLASETAGTIGSSGSNQPLAVNPTKTEMPDFAAKLEWHQPWGHFAWRAVVHDADLVDGAHINQHYIGYGGAFSGDIKPGWWGWSKDTIGFTGFAGDGLGRYAGGGGSGNYFPYLATNYGAPAGTNPLGALIGNPCGYGHAGGSMTAACAIGVRAATIGEWGGNVWYQHWWGPTLRTNIQFSVAHQDVPTALIGTRVQQGNPFFAVNKELVDAHINLIWSPVAFINTGFEYFYGHRQTVYNAKGDMNVILYSFITKF